MDAWTEAKTKYGAKVLIPKVARKFVLKQPLSTTGVAAPTMTVTVSDELRAHICALEDEIRPLVPPDHMLRHVRDELKLATSANATRLYEGDPKMGYSRLEMHKANRPCTLAKSTICMVYVVFSAYRIVVLQWRLVDALVTGHLQTLCDNHKEEEETSAKLVDLMLSDDEKWANE